MLRVPRIVGHLLIGAVGSLLIAALYPRTSVGQSTDSVLAAAVLYDEILGRLGSSREGSADRRAAMQLLPILPAEVRDEVFASSSPPVLVPGASERLRAWWRQQDPLPGSDVNERLLEHLRRVDHALESYADDTDARGYDDRGEVYVRFGKPSRVSVIDFDSPRLIDDLYQPGVVISPRDFPNNEFWQYPRMGNAAYFLFVEENNRYSIGEVVDLLPQTLRFGLTGGGRGQRRTTMALSTLYAVYEQLSLEHPDFASTFQVIDNYRTDRDPTGRLAARDYMGQSRRLLATGTTDPNSTRIIGGEMQPHEFVGHVLAAAEELDGQTAWRRRVSLPTDYSGIPQVVPELEIAFRSARFLDEDGGTRVEVYWTTRPGELMDVVPHASVLTVSVRHYTTNYETARVVRKMYRLGSLPQVDDVTLPTRTITMSTFSGMFHLAMQVDLRADTQKKVSPLRTAVVRTDSLQALMGDGDFIEMSDLKPVLIANIMEGEPPFAYPHEELWVGLPIGFYFEVYHLVYGVDDQTRYSVQYEISDPLGKRSPTSVSYTSVGTNRKVREQILLDLSSWNATGPVRVTVTVTDQNTGQAVERSLLFNMVE